MTAAELTNRERDLQRAVILSVQCIDRAQNVLSEARKALVKRQGVGTAAALVPMAQEALTMAATHLPKL